jgi:hypothetical protein
LGISSESNVNALSGLNAHGFLTMPSTQSLMFKPASQEAPMKYPRTLSQGLLVLSLGLAVLPALGEDDCDAPIHRWQSRDAVRQMAAAQGWQVERLKIDDGCYEIRFTDAQGRRFKAKIDPETLKVLKLKPDDHKRERQSEREREDQGAEQPPRPPQ